MKLKDWIVKENEAFVAINKPAGVVFILFRHKSKAKLNNVKK